MSQKTKDIIFYVIAGLFVAGAIACMVCEAVLGPTLPLHVSIILCILTFVLAVVGTFLTSKSIDRYRISKKVEEMRSKK